MKPTEFKKLDKFNKFEYGQLYTSDDGYGKEILLFESAGEYSSGLSKTLIGTLNVLGERGWELVSFSPHRNNNFEGDYQYIYVFKRQKA